MWFSSLRTWMQRHRLSAAGDRRPARSRRPWHLEILEDRCLLSFFTVTTVADFGPRSLRDVIAAVNADLEPSSTILFAIDGGAQTITPFSALPAITHPVFIDGNSQPGFLGTPLIQLTGTFAGSVVSGLTISGGDSKVQGLVINGFSSYGLRLQSKGNNIITNNYIGTDSAGTGKLGNKGGGVFLTNSSNNQIGSPANGEGNVIAGNNGPGITIGAGSTNTLVQGNYIGTDVFGGNTLGNATGISIRAANNTIGGTTCGVCNLIAGNGVGIAISGSGGNVVQGNYVGTDVTGKVALGNFQGISISGGASNTIGGTTDAARNLISGNQSTGIVLIGSKLNKVQGNYIGTDWSGLSALGNGGQGVSIGGNASSNTIGGTTDAARNLISGNQMDGVLINGDIEGGPATANMVQGNYIGTGVFGTSALGNQGSGVFIGFANNNTIGGTVDGARNLIAANGKNGVSISGVSIGANTNQVQGNYIGTDVNGTSALGNALDGVTVSGKSSDNTIGGTLDAARNVVAGNLGHGVAISGTTATKNMAQGNYIGIDATGTLNLGNALNGVVLTNASKNTIGGTEPGAGNKIAFSGNDGVLVDAGTQNAIRGNAIYSSTNLGIELVNNGNNNQAAPVLTSVSTGGGMTTIMGTLTSTAGTTFALDFFVNTVCNPLGGEGEQYLGSGSVMTDDMGNGSFMAVFPTDVPSGQFITATATDPANNTSAFSACLVVPDPPRPTAAPGLASAGSRSDLARGQARGRGWLAPSGANLVNPALAFLFGEEGMEDRKSMGRSSRCARSSTLDPPSPSLHSLEPLVRAGGGP